MAYTGTEAKIPLGEVGLFTDVAPDKCPPSALIYAKNIQLYNGTVQKAGGSIKWNAAPVDAGIVAAYSWEPTTVEKYMIAVTSAGSIYKGRDRIFGTAINTGLGLLNPNCVFASGGQEVAGNPKKLFLFTAGVTNPLVLSANGTAFATVTHPATDWATSGTYPKFGLVHKNRLWAFAGQRYYASDSGDHENFLSNNLADGIYPGEGGELLGAFVYKGVLFAFKDGGFVYALDDSDPDDGNWVFKKLASNFGLAAPNAIAEALDNMYAGNSTGTITDYAASQKLGGIEAADLVQNCQFETFLRGNSSKVGVPFQHMTYYAEKKLLLVTYRSGYYTYNDMLLVFDFGRDQVRPTIWVKGSPQCLAQYKDINDIARPMYGDKDGYLHLMDAEDRLEGSNAYLGDFQIPHLDFSYLDPSLSTKQKHFDFLAVHYIPEGNWNLSCDYYIDGRYIETIQFQMIQYDRDKLNVLTLGTDRLAQPTAETVKCKIYGSGRTFSARFYNSGSNQSFQIPAITVGFRAGGEEAERT